MCTNRDKFAMSEGMVPEKRLSRTRNDRNFVIDHTSTGMRPSNSLNRTFSSTRCTKRPKSLDSVPKKRFRSTTSSWRLVRSYSPVGIVPLSWFRDSTSASRLVIFKSPWDGKVPFNEFRSKTSRLKRVMPNSSCGKGPSMLLSAIAQT